MPIILYIQCKCFLDSFKKRNFKVLGDTQDVLPSCECSRSVYYRVLAALAIARSQCSSGITWILRNTLFNLREIISHSSGKFGALGTGLVTDKWLQKLCCGCQPKQLFRIQTKKPPSPISSLSPGSCRDQKSCKVVFSQQELRKRLTPLQYHVTQEKGTERWGER